MYKVVAYILCIPVLPNKLNNKKYDEEQNEYDEDTGRCEPVEYLYSP